MDFNNLKSIICDDFMMQIYLINSDFFILDSLMNKSRGKFYVYAKFNLGQKKSRSAGFKNYCL